MMNSSRKILSLLHWMAAVASIFLMFPVILIYETTVYGSYQPQVILYHFGIAIVTTLIGFVIERYLRCKHLVTVLLGAVILTAWIVFTWDYRWIGCYLSAVVGFVFGAYTGSHDYDSLLTPAHLYCSLGMHIAGIVMGIFLWLHLPIEYSFALYIPDVLVYLLLYYLVRNQSNVDYLMGRASVTVDRVPFSMRKYNLILTFVLAVPPLILYFLQEAVRFVLFLIGKGISGITWVIGQIVGVLFAGDPYTEVVSTDPEFFYEHEDIPLSDGGRRPFDYELVKRIIAVVIAAVCIFLLLYLLIKYKPFHNFKERFKAFLIKLMKKLDTVTVHTQPQQKNTAFVDRFTAIEEKKGKRLAEDPFKQWKYDYKAYLKLSDSEERYKTGFLLLREYYRMKRISLPDGDTADEIYDKMQRTDYAFDGAISDGYNLLYYAEQNVSTVSLVKLDECLDGILKAEEARKKEKY